MHSGLTDSIFRGEIKDSCFELQLPAVIQLGTLASYSPRKLVLRQFAIRKDQIKTEGILDHSRDGVQLISLGDLFGAQKIPSSRDTRVFE